MQQDQAKAAPLQMAEGEVLYMQQFHLGQVYSENSSQLAVLRTNRICPGIYPNAPPAGHPERRGAHLELEHGGAVGRQEELPDGRAKFRSAVRLPQDIGAQHIAWIEVDMAHQTYVDLPAAASSSTKMASCTPSGRAASWTTRSC